MSFDNPQVQPPDPLVGTTIGGRYKIVSKLGEGGMGAVYVGQQQMGTSVRKVAVKTLHPHLSHDPKILARFERECGTVSELQHPNTIQVFDFGKTDEGLLYIVMEFVEGRSVGEVLEKDGPMPPARVEKIIAQVCGSLAEAHGRGIVHRDLKPDNIVLCDRAGQTDWVEVLDFGIAKRSSEEDKEESKLTQQGMVLGTPPYMSPEQFTGRPIDARSDVYALGVMSYEMLSGRLPFHGNTAWEWASAHMTAEPAPIDLTPSGPNIPPTMKSAIAKSLAKNPDERFASVTEFFAAFSGASPVQAANVVRVDSSSGRGKTEIGAPMPMPAGGFGGGGQAPAYGGPPGPAMGVGGGGPASFGTPAAGNHAVAAVPPGPGRRDGAGGGGSSKGPLLAIAGVLAVLSVGAIAFAMRGSSTPSAGALDLGQLDAGTSAAVVDLTPEAGLQAVATPSAAPTEHAPLEPFEPSKPAQPTSTPKPATPKADAGAAPSGGGGTTGGTTAPATPKPPAAEPKECSLYRVMKSMNKMKEAAVLEQKCRALGGTP